MQVWEFIFTKPRTVSNAWVVAPTLGQAAVMLASATPDAILRPDGTLHDGIITNFTGQLNEPSGIRRLERPNGVVWERPMA